MEFLLPFIVILMLSPSDQCSRDQLDECTSDQIVSFIEQDRRGDELPDCKFTGKFSRNGGREYDCGRYTLYSSSATAPKAW